ncbi:Hypothetical protein SRAE_2000114900 [Strongyloides ratti]|uniref:Uncharacterized protein n=1 Tax=Strongyloides ratti TaxID=34506 RepID=A0A090L9L4_STRRB|nr:Hypothetical protein SRAE_2000114900 [Strongyloides ratti]CEF66481.1 Hypothetical protein SRAE_2000114900 [Strongyloides ratti]
MDAHMIKECMPTTEVDLKDELKKQESYLHDLKIQMAELNGKLKSDEKKRRENEIKDVQGNIEAINKRLKMLSRKNSSENNKIIDDQKNSLNKEINNSLYLSKCDNESLIVLEEKYLIEMNTKFKNDLAEEKEKIAKLIVDLNNKLQKLQIYGILSSNIKLLTDEEKEYWKNECEKENEKRRTLLADIHSLRDECAMLRASIEHCNLVSKNYLQTQI